MRIQHYLLVALMIGTAHALSGQAAGDLDPTFASGGRFLLTTTAGLEGGTNGVAAYPGGKIVMAAYAYSTDYDILIARLDAAGQLDTTFGTPGPFGIPQGYTILPLAKDQLPSSVVVQPDGKILIGGWSQTTAAASGEEGNFFVARFTADGFLDPAFGLGTGYVETDLMGQNGWDIAQGLAIDNLGNIVQAGFSYPFPPALTNAVVSVVKYHPNGALDASFNATGMRQYFFSNYLDIATAVAIRDDGRIVLGGYVGANAPSHSGILALQLKPNGDPDPSFGVTGKAIYFDVTPGFTGSKFIHALAIQPDGKVVLAGNMSYPGSTDEDMLVARLGPDGTLDATFGAAGTGMVLIPFGSSFDRGRGVGLDSHQNILVGGYTDVSTGVFDVDWAMACLRSNGTLNPFFGTGGKVKTDMGISLVGSRDYAHALVVQPDNKIVMVGDQDQNTIAAARYNGEAVGVSSPDFPQLAARIYPNPMVTNSFWLEYEVPCSGSVLIRLLDVDGKMVTVLCDKQVDSGCQVEQFILPQQTDGDFYLLHIHSECGDGVLKFVGPLRNNTF